LFGGVEFKRILHDRPDRREAEESQTSDDDASLVVVDEPDMLVIAAARPPVKALDLDALPALVQRPEPARRGAVMLMVPPGCGLPTIDVRPSINRLSFGRRTRVRDRVAQREVARGLRVPRLRDDVQRQACDRTSSRTLAALKESE